ncbi:MAG: sigma-E processing peptidase SpoIIGA [Bacillota bacterium]
MYVYADILVALNWMMNTAILIGTSKIAGITPRPVRIAISAGAGALASLLMLLPQGVFLNSPWVKVMLSLVMLCIAFYPLPTHRWPVTLAVFYLTSFTLGGLVLALLYFFDASSYLTNGVFHMQHASWFTFLSAALILCGIGHWTWGRLSKRLWQPKLIIPVRIYLAGRNVQIAALIDSGNCLKEPISHAPVVIAEYAALKPLLSPEVCALLDKTAEESWLELLHTFPPDWLSRLHIIPYSSLGRKGGLIIGFRPDYLVLEQPNGPKQCTPVIIGLSKRKLADDYRALLHPELVHGESKRKKEAS